MGFFQSLFNKERGHHAKKEVITPKDTHIATAKTPAPPMQHHSTVVTTETIPDSPSIVSRRSSRHSISSHHILPATSPTVPLSPQQSNSTSTHPSNSPPLSQRTSSEAVRRFQLLEDGTHMHHLTQPAQNRIAASLNGLVTGIANKSLRLTQWTERKVSLDEIMKERAALDVRLHRKSSEKTLAEKWGTCQETIGKGTSGVVRVAHKVDGTGERLYAVKVSLLENCLIPPLCKSLIFSLLCTHSHTRNRNSVKEHKRHPKTTSTASPQNTTFRPPCTTSM